MKLAQAIIATLTYSDHFGFPLTSSELHSRLIRVKATRAQLIRALAHFPSTRGYYHLPGRSSLVTRRLRRAQLSAPLQSRARALATRLGHIPGVLAIYLTGSLAVSNSGPQSDIDLMVITGPGRLWTTRLLLTLYTSLRSWRRFPHSRHSSGKLCLNLFLSPASYLLPPSRRSLYTAYELIQAVPIYDPHHTHSNLLSANVWIHSYLPNFRPPHRTGGDLPALTTTRITPAYIFEKLAYALQLSYMRHRITREYITPDSAFFHPHDPGIPILRRLRLLK